MRPSECSRLTAVLAAYAHDVVTADARIGELEADRALAQERIADLESERDTYREIALALVDGLRDLTVKHQTLTNQNQQLRDQNRALFEGLHVRCDSELPTYAGADDTEYVRAVGALPLLAAVRRVRSPGTKFDELLIIESAQGTGKSSALRALCPHEDWFSGDLPVGV